jgi:outer membrane protein
MLFNETLALILQNPYRFHLMFSLNPYIRAICLAAFFCGPATAFAADLLTVYQQAQLNDALYQQAVAERLSVKEGVPISISTLLPNITAQAIPSITRIGYSGSSLLTDVNGNTITPRNNTQQYYSMQLSLTQTVFDFAKFSQVAGALATSKGADATLNAAAQNLMVRVTQAYFAILQDEDILSYSEASKAAFREQLNEAKQQYHVGLKSITDVHNAQARYDSAVSTYIAAETNLANDKENLRVITGKYYPHLSPLSERFPLISPRPLDMEAWVRKAIEQNWTIKASQYSVQTALQNIRQQYAGHMPIVNIVGDLQRQYTNNINGYQSYIQRNGPATQTDKQIGLIVTLPIFSGGGVVAQTNQATYDYEATQQNLEKITRDVANATRQSYLNIVSGVNKTRADKDAIVSNTRSLQGMEEGYRAGTETLFNVLNQQEILFSSQTHYAEDRYAVINNMFALKQAAGTLSFDDLRAVNAWLVEGERRTVARHVWRHKRVSSHVKHKRVAKKSHRVS